MPINPTETIFEPFTLTGTGGERNMDFLRPAAVAPGLSRRQFFVTQVIGNAGRPDVSLATMFAEPSLPAILDFEAFRRALVTDQDISPIQMSRVDRGPNVVRRALIQAIADGTERARLQLDASHVRDYAEAIYMTNPLPVMHSPVSGRSLSEMGVDAAAFLAILQHDGGARDVALWFLFVGGTRIILGSSDAFALAMRNVLPLAVCKWLGVSGKPPP